MDIQKRYLLLKSVWTDALSLYHNSSGHITAMMIINIGQPSLTVRPQKKA